MPKNILRYLIILIMLSLLTACGSASGESGGSTVVNNDNDDDDNDDDDNNTDDAGNNNNMLIAAFETTEYKATPALAAIKASSAYAKGYTGAGQTVSIADLPYNLEHTDMSGVFAEREPHPDPANRVYNVYNVHGNRSSGIDSFLQVGCRGNEATGCAAKNGHHGTQVAGIVAANKNDSGMHGVAYNATIIPLTIFTADARAKLRSYDGSEPHKNFLAMIDTGTGPGIVAMNNSWGIAERVAVTYKDTKYYYQRPDEFDLQTYSRTGTSDSVLANIPAYATEFDAWEKAVADTVIVFPNGNEKLNSETGQLILYTNPKYDDDPTDNTDVIQAHAMDVLGKDAMGDTITDWGTTANIPHFRATFPLVTTDPNDSTNTSWANPLAGKFLAVVAVDSATDGTNKITSFSNGCGIAKAYCLAAPGYQIKTTNAELVTDADGNYTNESANAYNSVNGTSFAAPYVTGALAVIKEAFPTMTPEQLTTLVLETATYLPLDNMKPTTTCSGGIGLSGVHSCTTTYATLADEDKNNRTEVTKADGTTRYINDVYGYGLLNLDEATKPGYASYVTASNNESIGVLWTDTSLTLSSHFGNSFESIALGIGDVYGRHFVVSPQQINHSPIAVGLDDYMAGLLGENVQSERLNPQAQANYSNNGEHNWMNLHYTSGKATSKIAFQESYKINPLNDMGAAFELRANHIRPASTNIGMMDVDYALTRKLTLSSYAARGEYDTGYKFDELGTDIDLRHKKSSLNIGLGNVREHDQFLGTNTTGAYALSEPSISRFTDVTYGHDVGKKFNVYANYINYKTEVDMGYSQFATIDNLQADQYQIGFKGKNLISDDDGLNVALITKLGVTDGALNQNTVLGYTADGGFNNVTQSYDLSVQERHQQFEVTYQGRLYQHTQNKISALKHNRFFTTLRVDQNLNHVQDASQTEIIGGINARF